jgi:hypothetical protein
VVQRLEVKKIRDDAATVQALEAVMVALLILGAAYSVVTLRSTSTTTDKPRANLDKVVADSLTVLNGLADANGTLLEESLVEQLHCARDGAPSTTSCASGRGANLSERLDFYLPRGSGYAVSLDNGVRAQQVYATGAPLGEAVSSSFAFIPAWNLTFVVTELSCYDSSQDVNATMATIAHARLVNSTRANASAGGVNATVTSTGTGRWNATLPAATRPASGTLVANATAKNAGAFPGLTFYDTCSLGPSGNATVTALRQDSLTLPASVPLRGTATLGANLTHLANVTGANLQSANLTIYEPLPDRPGEADTWIPVTVLNLTGTTPTVTWSPPETSLFGTHPVVLRAVLKHGGTTYEARIVGYLPVALPNGVVPIDPPYRAVLQAWLPDWH